ncbi:MAG: Hsp20/alpha crystallin family protein [Fimbriimonadaceae bacterium]|nr:Hsp20/alpha crystallin family protein [Fimbriimonadaceae bacterium]
MNRTLMTINPIADFRAMDEAMERLFQSGWPTARPHAVALPIDVVERENALMIRAAVPGIAPADLDISVENQVLTIRGEIKAEAATENEKVYRREVSYGTFARSLRLPDKLKLEAIDAEFRHGMVTITIPKQVEEAPKALRINVRNAEPNA